MTVVGMFLSAGVWDALAVVFVAAPLLFITAVVLAVKADSSNVTH
jgi:hypothetical protein